MQSHQLGKIRFKALQILLLAQELKSLRAVATAVNTSQPAVTQTLQELEKTFGQVLLTRDHSGVALTHAGEILAARARVALAEMQTVEKALSSSPDVPVLRVGTLPLLVFDLLPRTLHHLAENEAPLRVRIHETTVSRLRERLFADEDDVVLTRLAAVAVSADEYPSLRIHRLATERVTLFVGRLHPLYAKASAGEAVDAALLADCRWVLPPESTEVRRHVDELLVLSGLPPSTPVVEVASLHSTLMTVSETSTVGAGPQSAVDRMTALLKLAPLRLKRFNPAATHTVAMYHARHDATPSVATFIRSITQVAQMAQMARDRPGPA